MQDNDEKKKHGYWLGSTYSKLGENYIGAPKKAKEYSAIKLFIIQYCDSNIVFFIADCDVIALNLLCFMFVY